MNGILILGAGGHAKVVADILLTQGQLVIGFLDDNPATWGSTLFGLPVLGPIDTFTDHAPTGLILAIGSNRARRAIAARLNPRRAHWVNAIHPRATIARSARLGRGVVVAAGAILNPDCQLGDHAIVNTSATVDHDSVVGDYAHLAPGCHLAGDVRVGAGALLGVGVSVKPGCAIGDWATVGVGAAVVRNIPPNVVAHGVPATWAATPVGVAFSSDAYESADHER
jgi:sugar O-acyltransferase (sialic acid O-acetyltransferase NeuD family)